MATDEREARNVYLTDREARNAYLADRVTTVVRLPKALYKQLKHEAIDREVSVNSLIEQAAIDFLARADTERKKD